MSCAESRMKQTFSIFVWSFCTTPFEILVLSNGVM